MKTYMGIKLIQAAPAQKDGKEGYNVIYPDGYASWSPKDVFEASYLDLGEDPTRITPPVIESMIAEVTVQKIDPKTSLVKSEQITGFTQYATAACVDPNNYSEVLGKNIAMKEIKDRLWFAMGFCLQWAKYGLKKVHKVEAPAVPETADTACGI